MEPAQRIDPPDWMTAPETRSLFDALGAGGATVRFVGGCVRDALVGRAVTDIDVATSDPPATVTELLRAAKIRCLPTGIKHGTVTALVPHLDSQRRFEITTLRRDVATDGRRATVAFTDDWAADAARRDFTINTLFCDLDGTLYDPCGGLADLHAGRVRFVGDPVTRIREDVLRLLRFFRFHAYYGRPPADAEALVACRAMALALPGLSGERVRDELLRILLAPDPAAVMGVMIDSGVFEFMMPEAAGANRLMALASVEGENSDALRRLALLLRAGSGGAEAVGGRLKLSNAAAKRLAAMVAPPVHVAADLDVAGQRRALYRVGSSLFADLALLAWAEALDRARENREGLAEAFGPMIAVARAWQAPTLPVGGDDVLALNIPDGPRVGALLSALEDWWIAGDFAAGREAALEKLAELAAAP